MSEFKQTSFSGGLNLLLDDTRLPVSLKYKEGDSPYDITYNQYRIGRNIRTRFDVCTPVKAPAEDKFAPAGLKQAILTFGNFVILFVAGKGYWRYKTQISWTQIVGFSMSATAPRYWTVVVPLYTTNYVRFAIPTDTGKPADAAAGIKKQEAGNVAGTLGNVSGLLVQDGINQPQFIYLDSNNVVQCRTTQTYSQWDFTLDGGGTVLVTDNREYVPVGTFMEWFNGILFIVAPDSTQIYRSVSGRPLDFVVNVAPNGTKGGDASTVAYSVGVSGITAIRAMPGNSLLVAAGGSACFSVTLNQTPNAPTLFGEYTFNRALLFNSNCITERGIIDISGPLSQGGSAGDSVFIDANGLRSFNAIEYLQNEGRNSVFSSVIQSLFNGVVQQNNLCAAINFDNYAIFSVNTVMGYVLVIYDTITGNYTAIDSDQIGNNAVKQFAAIQIDSLNLYAITSDDRVIQVFGSIEALQGIIRLGAVCTQDPKKEIKVTNVRAIFTNITQDFSITCSIFTNNRLDGEITTKIACPPYTDGYTGESIGSDVGTQTNSIVFPFPNASQGWKCFPVITWTGGASLASVSISTQDATPMQPPMTQGVVQQT